MIISEFSRIFSVLVRTETSKLCCRKESPPWDHKTQGNSVVVTQLVHNVRQFSSLDFKSFFKANGNSRECFYGPQSSAPPAHNAQPFEWKKSSLNNIISTILGSLCETVMQRREKWAEWKEKIKKGFRKNSSNYRRPSRAQNCATTWEILNFIASQDIRRFSRIHNSKAQDSNLTLLFSLS